MTKWLVLVASTAGSSVGWWLGSYVGLMTAFSISTVGLGVGIWAGRKLSERWGG